MTFLDTSVTGCIFLFPLLLVELPFATFVSKPLCRPLPLKRCICRLHGKHRRARVAARVFHVRS